MKTTNNKPHFINNNGYEFITNGKDHQDYPEGIKINRIKLVANIPESLRGKTLFNIGLNALGLNPHFTKEEILSFLWSVNGCKIFIAKPLLSSTLNTIVEQIFKKREKDGEIILVPNTTVYTVYSLDCDLTKPERRTHTNQLIGDKKASKSKLIMYEAIEAWDSSTKLTQESLAVKVDLSIGTIKKYWSEFKGLVKDINKGVKAPVAEMDIIPVEEEIIQPEPSKPSQSIILRTFKEMAGEYEFPLDVADQYINYINNDAFESVEEMLEEVKLNPVLKNLMNYKQTA